MDTLTFADATASTLRTLAHARALAPALAEAAQSHYDAWDESDFDTYAGGGICHLIADALAQVLEQAGILACPVSSSHEVHVFVAFQVAEGVFTLDIPWSVYEAGAGYSWSKLPGVRFGPEHLAWQKVHQSPAEFEAYVQD